MTESWRPIPDTAYEASDLGRIRRDGRVRHAPPDRQGYPRLRLYLPGGKRNFTVHALVARAFLGPRPSGYHVNHIDGDKTNNAASNLEYLSPAENQAHSTRAGLPVRGEKHPACKLTAGRVVQIRADHRNGATINAIASVTGVSERTIRHIVRRTTWRHVA